MSKKGKHIKIDHEQFKITYGIVNKEWNSCFVTLQTWVKPKQENNYDKLIKDLRKKTKSIIENNLDPILSKPQYIVDLDLRISGMAKTKRSFMSIEVILYPIVGLDIIGEEYIKYITDLSLKITNELIKEDIDCYLHKT